MREAAGILGRDRPLRILSFGCSTGAECLDAAEIFPNAHIVGLDINEKVLTEARAIEHGRITIGLSTEEVLEDKKPFDLILAMNVFCRYPLPKGVTQIGEVYPFGLFVDTINLLHDALSVGGIMALYNTMYFFEDCAVSRAYQPVKPHDVNMGWMPKFYTDGDQATAVAHLWDGQSYELGEWLRTIPPGYSKKRQAVRHRWINPKSAGSRRTDIALWYKRRP